MRRLERRNPVPLDYASCKQRLRQRVDGGAKTTVSGDFTLVPWRDVLEKQIGKQVGGIMRESGVSWTIGRGRGVPTIS